MAMRYTKMYRVFSLSFCTTILTALTSWCSANSYKYLVRDKILTLEEAVQRLDRLFEATKVADETGTPARGHQYELSGGIVEVLASIGGGDLSMIGDSPEQWEFIDNSIIQPDEFISSVAPTDPSRLTSELLNLPATRIEDCIKELRSWNSFREDDSTKEYSATIPKPSDRRLPRPRVSQSPTQPEVATPVRSGRTPRNAQCPCGSGSNTFIPESAWSGSSIVAVDPWPSILRPSASSFWTKKRQSPAVM